MDTEYLFAAFPPSNEVIADRHAEVQRSCKELTVYLTSLCPDSREKSLALTKVEEAMFWASAAIARHDTNKEN